MRNGNSDTVAATLRRCAAAGLSTIPVDPQTKKPLGHLLPRGPGGKPTWKPYQKAPADEATLTRWAESDLQALAVVTGQVSGGLLVLDFDVPEFYSWWVERVGDDAHGLPVQQTGGGGYQVLLRCPDPGGNQKLAWAPGEADPTGRTIAIETRGEGGYAVLAPSLHPSGQRYVWLSGDAAGVPTVPQERVERLLAAARALDMAPLTKQDRERQEAQACERLDAQRRKGTGVQVIDAFNAATPVESLLERHGYTRGPSGRYVRPGGTSESVTILDGRRSVHWSTNDPLNNGRGKSGCGVHDAFSLFVELEHAGDVKAAVRAAAQALNLLPEGPDDLDEGDDAEGDAGGGKRPKASELIVRLAKLLYRLGQSHEGKPFAVRADGPNLTIGLADLRDPLFREYRKQSGAPPSGQAVNEALAVLRADAADCPREPVQLRVAEHGDGTVIDLGDPAGRAIHATADGWQVLDRSPVLFKRTALTMAMPEPEPVRGGSRDELRRVLNVSDASWPALWAYLVASFIPEIPHPILYLSGQQGTGKSTAAKIMAGLIDPNPAILQSVPRDAVGWHFKAAYSWCVCLDNVSELRPEVQDCLCKAVTGDAYSRRALYTDDGLAVDAYRRVVLLTSIDAGALRGDLVDRLLAVELEPIPDDKRRTEREVLAEFEAIRSRVLGALLDDVAAVLRLRPTIQLSEKPRMADFAVILAALDRHIGGGFASLAFFLRQRKRLAEDVLEHDPVASRLVEWVRRHGSWKGTAGDLQGWLGPNDQKPMDWPKTAEAMAIQLKRLTSTLGQVGIVVEKPPRGARREWSVRLADPTLRHGDGDRDEPPVGEA